MSSRTRRDAVADTASIQFTSSLGPQTIATDTATNGAGLAITSDRRIGGIVSVGDRVDGTYIFKVQDSTDGSTWADVPAARMLGDDLTGGISAADTDQVFAVEVAPTRDNFRIVCTSSSTTSGAQVAGYLVDLGHQI